MPKNQPTDEPRPAETTTPQPTTDAPTTQVEQQIVEVEEREETPQQD